MLVNFDFVKAYLSSKVRSERAASLVEYALLVALIAVVCIAAVSTLGGKARDNFTSISNEL